MSTPRFGIVNHARVHGLVAAILLTLFFSMSAAAQETEFKLDEREGWLEQSSPEPGTDEAVIAEATRLLAEDQPARARSMINRWIKEHENTDNQWLPRAYLLRGDAKAAMGDEFEALFDYEKRVIRRYPQSEAFALAVERELEIAIRYAHGLKRKFLGMRINGTEDLAEEALIRVQERLPGSALAERAAIELADFYFRRGDLQLALIAYDLYLENFPDGPNRKRAMLRRILANIRRYKGPEYDASSLLDAREQVRRFVAEYPEEARRRGIDQELLERIEDSFAEQMLDAAKWYIQRDDRPSARFKLKRILRKHPESAAAEEAMRIMRDRGWLTQKLKEIGDDGEARPDSQADQPSEVNGSNETSNDAEASARPGSSENEP